MQILESVRQAEIHRAFLALEVLHIRQFGRAALGLAVCGAAALTLIRLSPSCVLVQLALASLYVLVPQVDRSYALLRQSLHFECGLA